MEILVKSLVIALLLNLLTYCSGEYTEQEKEALIKFRAALNPELLYRDFMSSDEFLINFLKARNMDINAAIEMLTNSIRWRKETQVDTILDNKEVKQFCDSNFVFQTDSLDKFGGPIIQAKARDWDVRRVLIAGKSEQLFLCVVRLMELMTTKVREQHNEIGGQNNITQFIVIIDLDGYNLRQHACLFCIPMYLNLVRTYEANYPQMLGKAVLLNVPAIFQTLLTIVKEVMSPDTREIINVYGYEKNVWQQALLNDIPADQLTPYYGGTKTTKSSH